MIIDMQEPHNIEAERGLLHQLLFQHGIDRGSVIYGDLTPECFFDGRNRAIYEGIAALFREGKPIDMIAVYDWLQTTKHTGVTPYDIVALADERVDSEASYLVQLLLRCQWRRQGILLCKQAIQQLYQECDMPDEVIGRVSDELAKVPMSKSVGQSTLIDATTMVLQQIDDNLDPATRHKGSHTGFQQIDETGGLPEVGVTVVAADTGQGKSSFGIDLAMQNLRDGEKVGYFTLEMPQEDLARRILSAMTGIPSYQMAYGVLTAEEQQQVQLATQKLFNEGGQRFFFDNRMETGVEGIIAAIRRLADPNGEHVTHFYVDYMQILSWAEEGASRGKFMTVEQLLAGAARAFHNISVKMKVQIVLLSQVNRDNDNRELSLDRIRDSKQIADAATCVVLIYRPEPYHKNYQTEKFRNVDPKGTALIHVAKRRNGPCVQFICGFDGVRTHFYPLDTLPMVVAPNISFGL